MSEVELVQVNRVALKELETEADAIVAAAQDFRIIRDAEHREAAAGAGKRIKFHRERLEREHRPNIENWYRGHKAACADLKRVDGPLALAEDAVRSGVGAWDQKQRDEAARIQREHEAEARRIAQEAEAARQLEVEKARAAEEERRLVEAQKLKDAGRDKAADAMLAAPIVVAVPPVVQPYVPPPVVYAKPTDSTLRENWKFRVLDPLVVPREYLMLDEVKIGKVCRALKGETKIPGIEAYNDPKAGF